MKVSTFNTVAIVVGTLVIASIAAIAWREASEGEFAYDGKSILITAGYVTHCQTMTQECHAAAERAIDWALARTVA